MSNKSLGNSIELNSCVVTYFLEKIWRMKKKQNIVWFQIPILDNCAHGEPKYIRKRNENKFKWINEKPAGRAFPGVDYA